ncbi:histidine--tRNA ligase [Clostridiales bacterium COT073_COT-073]|nr:histidine--tRNA ligase [Clostridiales bacterium COT073_COT-073]
MLTNAPRGTYDLFGSKLNQTRKLEDTIRQLCADYGYGEIRTPIFEHTELFARGMGEGTDVVQKEMYTFEDKKGRSITLKPEGTAGTVRAYLENKIYAEVQPSKLFYITPAFRYEKPQAGRLRQFHQFGIELLGSDHPLADAEVIALGYRLLQRVGLKKVILHLNSLGGKESASSYKKELLHFLHGVSGELCPTCRERMEKNPLRVLDCKIDTCKAVVKDAPVMVDYLVEEDAKHFEQVKELLRAMEVPFEVDPWIVRGLDYYTGTVFEFVSSDIGAQSTICGGGRYNNLVEEIGGSPTPAVGFGVGIERLLMTIEAELKPEEEVPSCDLFIGYMGEAAMKTAVKLVSDFREKHIKAVMDLNAKSVKAQMKYANKVGARFSVVLGENEITTGQIKLKNMETGEEKELALADLEREFC